MVLIDLNILAADTFKAFGNRWNTGIKILDKSMYAGQVDAIGIVPCLIVDLRTTNHEAICRTMLDGFDKRMIDFDASAWLQVAHHFLGDMEETVARHHNIATSRQWTADRLVCLSTHNDSVAFGSGLEVLQVGTQMPRHCALVADGIILGCSNNNVNMKK